MGKCIDTKQITIYIALLLVCSTFTLIVPFYPQIANNKGLPIGMIGAIISLNPFINLLTSLTLGKYMNKIGRKNAVISCFFFTSASMILLSPIEYCNLNQLIILSVTSRVIGGIGSGCLLTAITTIFISDYPERIQVMIGRMEGAIGIGLILGPLIGTALYLINLFAALVFVGSLVLLFTPIAWKLLGNFREYNITNIAVNRFFILTRPVKCI